MVRGYGQNNWLFKDFPGDTAWRLVSVTPEEVRGFKYVKHDEGWAGVAGSTRLVADGAKKFDQAQGRVVRDNVVDIANRVRQGVRFPALIAVQCAGNADVGPAEGDTRATAYALTGLPDEADVLIGTSAHMASWACLLPRRRAPPDD